jgi:hypothetical protein
LINLAGVSLDGSQIVAQIIIETNVFPNNTPEHFVDVLQRFIQIKHAHIQHLAVAKTKELAG